MSEQIGFLIEDNVTFGRAMWAYIQLTPYRAFKWTEDSWKALRFSRRCDAEAVKAFMQDNGHLIVTEHLWCDDAAPVSAKAEEKKP